MLNYPLARYSSELRRVTPIDADEEKALAAQWRNGDAKAGRRLIEGNLEAVVQIALKYRRWGVPIEDLVQQGNIGLLKAAAKFDPTQACRLTTYATYWIRAEIRDYVIRSYRIVRLGTTKTERRAVRSYRTKGIDSAEALAMASGMPTARAQQLWPLLKAADVSLDLSVNGATSPMERIRAESETPEELVANEHEQHHIRKRVAIALSKLPERERQIVRARWLSDSRPTLAQLGRRLGVSKERVRQLEARAYERLRAELAEFAPMAA